MIADILWPIIGFMATAFAVSSTIPQMKKALKTKKSDDIWNWKKGYCNNYRQFYRSSIEYIYANSKDKILSTSIK